MAPKPTAPKSAKPIEALVHSDKRRNIPTAEFQSIAQRMEETAPVQPAHYPRATPLPKGEQRERNADLDPQVIWRGARIRLTDTQRRRLQETGEIELGDAQLVWRGKDAQDWSDLVVNPPPIYIQEKVHPKAIIDGLRKEARARSEAANDAPDLFADFNGLSDPEARLEFYQHDQHWSNRMILGDSLQVMASLAEREGLRGKVQCIYFDPPYGIKFNSNWQVSTLSRDVKDGKREDVSREPEQVKAFRDTWKDGIHSYLTYLRDRLAVARELLAESGSVFVQIGDDNVHSVRSILDEIFGSENFISIITVAKTTGAGSPSIGTDVLASVNDFVVWYSRDRPRLKYRQLYNRRKFGGEGSSQYNFAHGPAGEFRRLTATEVADQRAEPGWSIAAHGDLTSQSGADTTRQQISVNGRSVTPKKGGWKTNTQGTLRLTRASRLVFIGDTIRYIRRFEDFAAYPINNYWSEFRTSGFGDEKLYVVQTNPGIVERCILMSTDPGDLVLDPTCGSGTTASVAEQMGRRWITVDTSRVALALARIRIMSSKYPYYLLADSREGRTKEQDLSGRVHSDTPTHNDVRQGFVYERAPHVTLKSIANNAEIDVIWEEAQAILERLRADLNTHLGQAWEEWHIPRIADPAWPEAACQAHAAWWTARIDRQRRIDASIARRADIEYLYDRPYEDRSRVRVAGPFTVESLSPHRVVPADEDDLLAPVSTQSSRRTKAPPVDFATMVLENLRTAGVHQSQKADSIRFTSLAPWPGTYIGAEGRFMEGETERRAGILIGPEFGTLSRMDLVTAAREASEARFDVLIACAFNYDAHASELTKLGPLPILKARMNPDLHMADDLKNTGKGNLFVVFGEPD